MDWIELLDGIAIFIYRPATCQRRLAKARWQSITALAHRSPGTPFERSSVRHVAGYRAAKHYRYYMRAPTGTGYLTRRGGDAELAR
jgi:hypothetical protein